MRRFPRHGHPQPVALSRHGAAVGEYRHAHHHRNGERLQYRERSEVSLGRQGAVVDRCDGGIGDRRVLPVEPGRVERRPGIVERRLKRQVGGGGDPAGGIGDDQWQPQRPHLLTQPKQRFGFGRRHGGC